MKRALLLIAPILIACGPVFYQAPPPLASYLERIPTKAWNELLEEARPKADTPRAELIAAVGEFVGQKYPALERAARLAEIDAFLSRNRDGEFDIPLANFLIELREIADGELADDLTVPYLKRRAAAVAIKVAGPRKPLRSGFEKEAEFETKLAEYRNDLLADNKAYAARIADIPAALLPYEMIHRGGQLFRLARFIEADAVFRSVFETYPDHPRAEIARFMTARCALEAARQHGGATSKELLGAAEERFTAYFEKHPDGRFTDDAHGWLGGIQSDQDQVVAAIEHQLRRLEIQSTREVARSVLRECSQLFTQLLENPESIDFTHFDTSTEALPKSTFDLLARNPLAARLFVYHALDPASQIHLPIYYINESGDRGTLEFLRRRIVRPGKFAEASLSGLGAAIIRQNSDPDPTSLLILGWAATRSGDQFQALALLDRALATTTTDELLHARAIVLTRLDRHAEAAATYEKLFKVYPESPLTAPSRFDHAIALQRSGQAGESFLALLELTRYFTRLSDRFEPPGGADPLYLHPEHEALQWIDSLAQFSPLEELLAPLDRLPAEAPEARLLRAVVRTRALCEEDFDLAARLLDAPESQPVEIDYWSRSPWHPYGLIHLNQTRWDAEIADLAATSKNLESDPEAPGAARLHLQLGNQWAALRGRLTLPLHGILAYGNSENQKIDQLRRANARFIGIPAERAAAELDSRDELRHALRHFLAAAEKSTDPNIASPALEAANEALFRLAEFSLYACSRAAETGATELSAKLVGRLRSDFPDRPETARALPFSFVPPDLLGAWMPGDYNSGNSDWRIHLAIHGESPDYGRPGYPAEVQARVDAISASLHTLDSTVAPLEETREKLDKARSDFAKLRPKIDSYDHLDLIDDLDDLHAAAHTPGVDGALLREYAAIRLPLSVPPALDDHWKPLAPYLEFIDRIRPDPKSKAWPIPGRGDDIESWREFLKKYPDSPKSEPASLRLIRLQVRAVCPIPHTRAFHFPDSPITDGYKRLEVPKTAADFDYGALTAAIAAHRKNYPGGRYEADLSVLEAAVASRAKDYPLALSALSRVLADPAHSELRQDASLYFAEISQRLLDPAERPALVPAFRGSEDSLTFVKNLASGDTSLSRLRPLLGALGSLFP